MLPEIILAPLLEKWKFLNYDSTIYITFIFKFLEKYFWQNVGMGVIFN